MARSAASYILMLDEQSSQAQNVLHTFVCLTRRRRARHKVLQKTPFQTWHGVAKRRRLKHCFRLHFITPRQVATAPQYEAAPVFISLRRGKPFHSDMKHSLRSYDEKMENESLSVCNTTLSALHYDLQSSPLWLDFFMS